MPSLRGERKNIGRTNNRNVPELDLSQTIASDNGRHSGAATPASSRPASSRLPSSARAGRRVPPDAAMPDSGSRPRTSDSRLSRPRTGEAPTSARYMREQARRDELFHNQKPPARGLHFNLNDGSRPGTGQSSGSRRSSRPSTAPSQSGLPVHGGRGVQVNRQELDDRPQTGSSIARSDTSSMVEERLVDFQKCFQDKNSAKYPQLSECFRYVDMNKNGRLGREELLQAMRNLDLAVDEPIVDRLMARCSDPDAMTMQEFKDLLWVDESMDVMIDERINQRAGVKGDNSNARYLWTPAKSPAKYIGTLNDTLEVDKIQSGKIPPRLDMNFSSVSYNILTFNDQYKEFDKSVPVPVKNRTGMFDPPPNSGRRVAYDHGDTPYDVISLKTPRRSTAGFPIMDGMTDVPIRLTTFARINRGEYPTQQGHMLTKSTV